MSAEPSPRPDLAAEPLRRRAALAWLASIVLVGLALTTLAAVTRQRANTQRAEAEFERLTDRIVDRVSERMRLFEYGLRGGRGAFVAAPGLTADCWRAYMQSRDVDREFWGALGFGYVARVARTDVDDYVAAMRTTFPEFSIQLPDGGATTHPDLFVIQFLEPLQPHRYILGLDIGAERRRREAAERAMRSGLATLSAPIRLRQLDGRRLGLLYLLPIYRPDAPTTTEEERVAALRGWIYAPIVVERAMRGISTLVDGLVDFDVYDGDGDARATLLYDDDRRNPPDAVGCDAATYAGRRFLARRSLQVGDRPWTIVVSSNRTFEALYAGVSTLWSWAIGILLTTAAGACFWALANSRSRAIALANAMTSQLAERHAELELARAQAVASTEAKSRFLAHMSHELRTPLTAILGFSQLLAERDVPSAERIENALTIHRNAEHMLTLINEVLDSSKIEAGRMTVEHIPMSLVDVVTSACKLFAKPAAEKGLRLEVEFATAVPERVLGDPTRLRQILMNLLGNAVKFTAHGQVRIAVACTGTAGDAASGRVLCRVSDTGKGMTPDQLARLFRAFEQADLATARLHGGTGLGLSISKQLAHLLGGDLTVASQPGQGTTFTLELPLRPTPGAQWLKPSADSTPAAAASATAPSLSGRVLLVDDGADNRRLIGLVLERAGANVETAENGQQAVDKVLATRSEGASYDLILMDMQMPGLDGPGATRALRRAGVTTPIVALTANLLASDQQTCRDAGCDGVLGKPIQRPHFLAACRDAIERGRAARPDAATAR
jgi:signal transduction histidine kinase/CheY-like chemotaxis protein